MSLELAGQWAPTVEEITNLHSEIAPIFLTAFEKAVRIGEILTQVRGALKHGEWLPWVSDHLPFSHRTAWDYLSAFERQDVIRPKLEAASNLNWRTLVSSNGNGEHNPAQLHESNFYSRSIRLTQSLMGEINHELKDHPLETWGRDKWISVAAATEPVAELHQRIKALLV